MLADIYVLAHVDAALNATALVLILIGLWAIKSGRETLHKKLMLGAAAVSAAFLACYVTYHTLKPEPVRYQGEGVLRTVYYVILPTHIVLAAALVVLVPRTLWLGWKDRRARHRRWAKVTAPVWLYVSFTGVVVWAFLYL